MSVARYQLIGANLPLDSMPNRAGAKLETQVRSMSPQTNSLRNPTTRHLTHKTAKLHDQLQVLLAHDIAQYLTW